MLTGTLSLGVYTDNVAIGNRRVLDLHHAVRLAKRENAASSEVLECTVRDEDVRVDEYRSCVEVQDVTDYFAASHIQECFGHRNYARVLAPQSFG